MYFLAEQLSPEPVSPVDGLGQDHDRAVPGSQTDFGDSKFNEKLMQADARFIFDGYLLRARYLSGDPELWQWQYNRSYDNLEWVERRGWGQPTRAVMAAVMTFVNVGIDVLVIEFGMVIFAITFTAHAMVEIIRAVGRFARGAIETLKRLPPPGAGLRKLQIPLRWRL